MGFYAPAQIVRDASDHGVEVRDVDVNHSLWDSTLEPGTDGRCALRLGFRMVKGLAKKDVDNLLARRGSGYRSLAALQQAGVRTAAIVRLAEADAFRSLGLSRRQAVWAAKRLETQPPLPLFTDLEPPPTAAEPALPVMTPGEEVVADYRHRGLSLKAHPMTFLRPALEARGVIPARALDTVRHEQMTTVSGVVITRQRPGTASGIVFITLEDETGVTNLVVFNHIFERFRRRILGDRILICRGRVEKAQGVIHVIAERFEDAGPLLPLMTADPDTDAKSFLAKGRFFF